MINDYGGRAVSKPNIPISQYLNHPIVVPLFRHASIFLCTAVAALLTLGLVMLASTGAWVSNVEDPYHFFSRQAWMAALGVIGAFGLARLDSKWLRKTWPWQMLAVCILLALCFVPGVGKEIFGSKRWISLPVIGQFQPSELAKIVCVVALAGWFARWQTETGKFWRGFVWPGVIVAVPVMLIMAETDVGTALALSVAIGAVMFCVGTRLLYLVPTALTAMAGAFWFVYNNPNRWSRIEAWLDLEADPLGKAMQQLRSLYAFGNGGPEGVGLGNGSEKFGTLTFAHIDFIFPVIGEELGLIGTLGTVLCFVTIAVMGCAIAAQASNVFDRCLALGLTAGIVVPAMVNIGVTTAVLPNDGLPLPFVSYGGTSLVFTFAAVGLLCGVHRRSRLESERALPLAALKSYAVKL